MRCKYDNSMYTTIPPTDFDYETEEDKIIAILDYPEEQIREHNFEESYTKQQLQDEAEFEKSAFMELVKNEPKSEVF